METEDIDRNRFMLDVTKTDFLEEEFAVSRPRAGFPTTSNAAKYPQVREEDGMHEQTSSRPSSANSREATDEVRIAALSKAGAIE